MKRFLPKVEFYIRNRTFLFLLKKSFQVLKRYGASYYWHKYLRRKTGKILHRIKNVPLVDIRINDFSLFTPAKMFVDITRKIGPSAALLAVFRYRMTLGQLAYLAWREKNEKINPAVIRRKIGKLKYRPLVSAVVYCEHRARHEAHGRTIASLENQIYHDIEITTTMGRSHMAVVKQSQGDLILYLRCGDILAANAVYEVVEAMNKESEVALVYTDEDQIDSKGMRLKPFFKPDWSPDLERSFNYVGNFVAIRKNALTSTNIDGKISSNLIHRLIISVAAGDRGGIHHVPKVLCHQEMIRDFKPLLSERNRGVENTVVSKTPSVTIIIPFRDQAQHLETCVESILKKTTYSNFRILLVNNQSGEDETYTFLGKISSNPIIGVLDYDHPFNYSAINNFAASVARSELILFLNNDTEVITPDWLSEMVQKIARSDVGAVGARLLYVNKTVQHAGVTIGLGGAAGHPFRNLAARRGGYFGLATSVRNVSAVTGACLLTKKSIFESVGGFDETNLRITYNDVDYCLKVLEAGYLVVYTPYAELYHHESLSCGRQDRVAELRYFRGKWKTYIDRDPYYNPNLTREKEDYSIHL